MAIGVRVFNFIQCLKFNKHKITHNIHIISLYIPRFPVAASISNHTFLPS